MNLWSCRYRYTLRSWVEAFEPILHPQRLSGCLSVHIVRRFTFQGREDVVYKVLWGRATEEDIRLMKVSLKGHSWGRRGKDEGEALRRGETIGR